MSQGAPKALDELRARAAELVDLGAIGALLFWDRSTQMPPGGAAGRAEQTGTLERIHHEKLTDPQIGRWLDEAERWAEGAAPDADTAREIAVMRRDFEKAIRVPADLAAEAARADALGEQAWLEAREADDFSRLRDALERHLELRRRYADCFEGLEHPYDALLDDYEPGFTTAMVRPLFAELREGLVPLVADAGEPGQERNAGLLHGDHPVEAQVAAMHDVLAAFGFRDEGWRLDPSAHPFAQSISTGDVRITTKYDPGDLGVALYSVMHEWGHGMYDASVDPGLGRSILGRTVSLALHESQSRLWENEVGRSLAFCRWVLPVLQRRLDLGGLDAERMFWGVNTVQPSPIRILADETTYNLHIVLRFELELALIEGSLAVADLPDAWAEATHRLLGLEVTSDNEGVLQDIHWGAGLIGYFPTYALGNLTAAQLWQAIRRELPDLDEQIEQGDFMPLRGWLREHVHAHGRRLDPPDVLARATGEELAVEPLLRYLREKLETAGVLAASGL